MGHDVDVTGTGRDSGNADKSATEKHLPPAQPTMMGAAQQSLGSAVIQRKMQSRIQRKSGTGTTKPAAPKPTFLVNAQGDVFQSDAPTVKVGFKVGGKTWIAASGKNHGMALAAAVAGSIRTDASRAIYEVEEAQLAPAKDAAATPTKDGPAPAKDEHAPKPAINAADQHGDTATHDAPSADATTKMEATFTGTREGLLADGTQILTKNGGTWAPKAPKDLPPAIASKLDDASRIDVGEFLWVYMSFALKDEKTPTARWVPPGHSKKEVQDVQSTMEAEAKNLPAESDVRNAVDGYIRTISLVSSVEGNFGSVSPSSDTYASLGIFQWAMPKNSSGDAGSLGMFFRNLKERAAASTKKPDKERTAEDKLYIAAWAQCTAHKLDVNGNQITLNGKAATGGEIESEMKGDMAKGDLRTYQMVAARDWIEQFKGTIVRPGPSATGLIGNGYDERGGGATISLTHGADTFTLQGSGYATVGSLFSSEHSLATAVMLGVNRPNYVEAALWRALNPKSDPQSDANALLAKLETLLTPAADPHAPAPDPKHKTKPAAAKAKKYTQADIDAAGPDAQKAWADLKAVLWPNRTLDAEAQTKLEGEFKSQAMKLYNPDDARKYKREQRFSTVEAARW